MVRGEWKRGHASRGVGGYRPPLDLLPGPDDVLPDDIEEAEPDPEPEPPPPPVDVPPVDGNWADLPPDPGPSWAGDKAKPKKPGTKAKGPRVTVAVANDVRGQLALLIGTTGSIISYVDPVCGGAAVANTAPMADAWTDVVLQSPSAVAFFTGPAGSAMLLFRAIVASAPLVTTVWNHHIAHTIEAEGEPQPERQYAA